jgi:phospholipase D1/2
MSNREDDHAYGDDYSKDRGAGSQGADRGIVGDTFKFLKNKYQQSQHSSQSQPNYGYTEQPYSSGGQQYPSGQQSSYVSTTHSSRFPVR